MHQRTRLISFLLVVSILLSTLYLPIAAEDTAVPEAVSPAISSVPETVANAPAELLQGIPVDFENEAILQYVDQDVFRASNHIKRLPQEETLDTYVYLNQDGTKSVYFMEENVKYVDANGNVQNKDISLKETKNGFTTVQNDVSVFIPTNAANGIQVSHSIGNVKLIPQNSLLVVAGRQDGDSVLYPNYFGKGISLRYTPLLSGVKEDIILASYTGTHSFQFALETNGLFVYEDAEAGYYVASAQDAADRYFLGEIIVYDAVGRPSIGTMTVKTVAAGARYILTVTADPAFLTDANTVYPVTIDPTITIGGANDTNKQIWDVPIFSGYPSWTCGAYQYLTLGNAGGNYGTGRAIIKLPGLYESAVYQNTHYEKIVSVKFYCTDGSGNAAQYINLYPHIDHPEWTESNASWIYVGGYDTSYNMGTTVSYGSWSEFNIIALVRMWKQGLYNPEAGFQLVNSDEVTREKHKAIHATEYATASYRPYVVFTYHESVFLSSTKLSLLAGQSATLSAETIPAGVPITWISDDTSVATVNSEGVVVAKRAGRANIIASAGMGVNTCVVDVYYNSIANTGVLSGDYLYIQNENSEYFLGVQNNSTIIRQYSLHGESSQSFKLRRDATKNCYQLYPQNAPEKVVSYNKNTGGVEIAYDLGQEESYWHIKQEESGYYTLQNKSDNNKFLCVSGDATSSSALVICGSSTTSRYWMLHRNNDYIYDAVNELHSYALAYTNNSRSTALDYVLQYIRSNRYNSSLWERVAGEINESFVSYIDSTYPQLQFLKNELFLYDIDGRGEPVDFRHMVATLNGLRYDTPLPVKESIFDDLCGWAGDLQQLTADVLENVDDASDAGVLYEAIYERIGTSDSVFSLSDVNADFDAINFNLELTTTELLGNQLNDYYYYAVKYNNRYSAFVNNRLWTELHDDVLFYVDPPLEVMKACEYEITAIQADAVANAFTVFISNKLG